MSVFQQLLSSDDDDDDDDDKHEIGYVPIQFLQFLLSVPLISVKKLLTDP